MTRHSSLFPIAARRGLALALLVVGAACRTTAPSTDVPFSKTDLVVGAGDAAAVGQFLTVDYIGYMYDSSKVDGRGPVFDSTAANGPFSFQLSSTAVIPGWVQGIPGMQIGGTRRLVIPPDLAYGTAGVKGAIPPNATLVFDITLNNIQ